VLFTSGTSGLPKGAGLTRGNFLWSALASAAHLGMQPGDRWLACMPLFHVGGLSILLRAALYGNTVVVHPRFEPAAVNHAFDRGGITHASLVATMLARVLDERGARRAPPQLRCILLGGGPAPDSLLVRARELGFPIAPTYGLTEAASQVATRAPGDTSAAGLRPLLCSEIRVVDDDDRDLPDGEPGELLVRGPTVMREYVNRPEATEQALRGGWLHTGDVAVRSEDGCLDILERRSDLIISGGENVYPSEVERVLLAHPTVAEAAVTGVDDPDFGQRAAAWLVARDGASPDPEQLRAHCRRHLAAYKVPVAFRTVNALPRNAAGKLLRRELPRTPGD
jgi:O-succinylbenzoic acid--CoA ligase